MGILQVQLPSLHSGQQQVRNEAKRFNVLCCGRRFGKSTFGIDLATHPVLVGYPVGWFAPTNKSLSESWELAKITLKAVTSRTLEQSHTLELITGGKIEFWSLEDPDGCRGRKYKRVIVDEAAHVAKLQYAWELVISPTLMDYQGDAWFLSTPRGMNYFRTLYAYGQDPTKPEWMSWQMPTAANPFIPAGEIAAMRTRLGEAAFNQECLAQFVNWEGSVFRYVFECAKAEPQTGPKQGHVYAFGIDWAQRTDYTAVAIIDITERACVALERWQGLDYPTQENRVVGLNARWKPVAIVAESNSMGQPVIENLWRRRVPITPYYATNQTKALVIEGLALAFERQTIKIIPDEVLQAELNTFQAEKMPGGGLRYAAASGHDDTVIALAIGWSAVENYAPQKAVVHYYDPGVISKY